MRKAILKTEETAGGRHTTMYEAALYSNYMHTVEQQQLVL